MEKFEEIYSKDSASIIEEISGLLKSAVEEKNKKTITEILALLSVNMEGIQEVFKINESDIKKEKEKLKTIEDVKRELKNA